MATPPSERPKLDLRERGGPRGGEPQFSDRRLFMQLLVFTGAAGENNLIAELQNQDFGSVLYADLNDPKGVALLTWSEDPSFFVERLRTFLRGSAFAPLQLRPELTMIGRSYALGHEPNLEDWLLRHSIRAACNPESPWAIWYPLRRAGAFSALPPEEQRTILREHGTIGFSYGEAGWATDIRLACFGLDEHDNDFVIGLTGKQLFPLSSCVQAMRKTRQTSQYMANLGPFFTGKALFQRSE